MAKETYELKSPVGSNESAREVNGNTNVEDRDRPCQDKENVHPPSDGVPSEEAEYREYYLECGGIVTRSRTTLYKRILQKKRLITIVFFVLLAAAYFVYFGFSMWYSFGNEASFRLLFGTAFILLVLFKIQFGKRIGKHVSVLQRKALTFPRLITTFRWGLYLLMIVLVVTYLAMTVLRSSPENLISLGGLAFFILIGFIISKHPDRVNWHAVFWGIGTQFLFALLILRTGFGYKMFLWLGDRIEEFLKHTEKASEFVFGETYREHNFTFGIMPMIVTMSATVNVLYHFGILQAFVANFGWFLTTCLGTSAVESVSTALSMFLGPAECPFAVKPFLPLLTSSEMHAVMAANFASIAGSVFGMLLSFGVPANHLLSATVMSVPAALAMAKLVVPEKHWTRIKPKDAYTVPVTKYRTVLEAISAGAVDAIKVIGTVMVNQIVFIAAVDFVDMALQWFGARVGFPHLTFALICSYLFYPITYLMGFPSNDLFKIGELLGIKVFANSFVGFYEFGKIVKNGESLEKYVQDTQGPWHWENGDVILEYTNKTLIGGILTRRSEVIGTYALCGLNHLGAIGVTMGVMTALAPQRKDTINKYVLLANITGQLACFLTACIAEALSTKRYNATTIVSRHKEH